MCVYVCEVMYMCVCMRECICVCMKECICVNMCVYVCEELTQEKGTTEDEMAGWHH